MPMMKTFAVAAGSAVLLATTGCAGGSAGTSTSATPSASAPATATTTPSPSPSQSLTEPFDGTVFANPTAVDNQFFPLTPGRQIVLTGGLIEDGEKLSRRVVSTVSDMTKVIDGVRSVVLYELDYTDGELTEAELAFFAQADDGTVWHMGEYPEEVEGGKITGTPGWISGFEGAKPGISMQADPQLGRPSYSQGWGPAVSWNDRATVVKLGQKTCVKAGCYENVLVTDEYTLDEPDAHQLKYYAPGVGNIKVGWTGDDPEQEELELVRFQKLNAAELAKIRQKVLAQEKRAYKLNKKAYGQTPPMERAS